MTMTTKLSKAPLPEPILAAERAITRSHAAYKAHITRQKQILAKSRSPAVKRDTRKTIKQITARMNEHLGLY